MANVVPIRPGIRPAGQTTPETTANVIEDYRSQVTFWKVSAALLAATAAYQAYKNRMPAATKRASGAGVYLRTPRGSIQGLDFAKIIAGR